MAQGSEYLKLQSLCRCCHSEDSSKNLYLTYSHEGRIEVYSSMLLEALDIMIKQPVFPVSCTICESCIVKLREATSFKHQVLDCERKFEEYCRNPAALENHPKDYELCMEASVIPSFDDKIVTQSAENIKAFEENVNNTTKVEEIEKFEESTQVTHDADGDGLKSEENGDELHEESDNDQANGKRKKRKYERSEVPGTEVELRVKTDHGIVYSCKICGKGQFKHIGVLRDHIQHTHKDAYKCKTCGIQLDDFARYSRHVRYYHIKGRVSCKYCNKTFTTTSALGQHINSHTRKRKFQCDICKKFFAYKMSLVKHLRLHTGIGNSVCRFCGKSYTDNTSLKYHIQSVHERSMQFKCNVCTKTFNQRKHLLVHSKIHLRNNNGSRSCELCMKKFASHYELKQHILYVHYNEKEYWEKYGNKESKVTKVNKVTEVKTDRYQCDMCSGDFKTKADLREHKAVHYNDANYDEKFGKNTVPDMGSIETRYLCELCMETFTSVSALKKHKATHKNSEENSRKRKKTLLTDVAEKRKKAETKQRQKIGKVKIMSGTRNKPMDKDKVHIDMPYSQMLLHKVTFEKGKLTPENIEGNQKT